MRPLLLLVIASLVCVGCLAQPPPTPVEVIQYPATWTPAPTPTRTPLPPTATRVIQRTPGAVATRDPNTRSLPAAPRTGPGFWLDLSEESASTLAPLAPRVPVIVTDGTGNPQTGSAFVLLASDASPPVEPLAPRYNGVLVTIKDVVEWDARRSAIAPRLLLAAASVTDTESLAALVFATDGARIDNFMREPEFPPGQFRTEQDWVRDVAALDALSSNPNLLVLTSTRLPADPNVTVEQTEEWFTFALASFLLGVNNSHTFFGFESALTPQLIAGALQNLEIGVPIGPPFKQNGVYQRRFTRGLVLANPGVEPRAFALSRTYRDANGVLYNQVAMPPHAGMILLNAE